MALRVESGCINHPAIEAVGRCKQCGKPFCSACRIQGPTGNFCSDTCKSMHERFTERAQQLDKMSKSGGFLNRLWWLGKKIIVIGLTVVLLVAVATYLGVNIPVASDILRNLINR